ncbi:hypothetical protein Tco_0572371 [Tanacetum coccineum]
MRRVTFPTGRVVVPTGRYVVPAGKVIIIVSPGRLSLVPTGRVLSPSLKRTGRDGDGRVQYSSPRTLDDTLLFREFVKAEGIAQMGMTGLQKILSPRHLLFVSTTRASKRKMSYAVVQHILHLPTTTSSNLRLGLIDLAINNGYGGRWDLKWQMAMPSVRVHKFEQKARRKIDFDKKESARFNKKKEYDGQSDGVIAPKEFGMIAGCDTEEGAAKIYNLITGADTKEASTAGVAGEFALMGVTSELGWDDSAFSIFTTNSKEVEGRPLFNRFAKADSMKAMPPPISGDYTPLSDHIDLDINSDTRLQRSYHLTLPLVILCLSSMPKSNVSTSCASIPEYPHLRQYSLFVPTDRGYSPSVTSGGGKSTARLCPI